MKKSLIIHSVTNQFQSTFLKGCMTLHSADDAMDPHESVRPKGIELFITKKVSAAMRVHHHWIIVNITV